MKMWRFLKNQPKEVWILCLTILINRSGTMVLPFLVLYLTQSLKFSVSMAGLALTVFGVGSLLASPLAGRLSDRIGPLRLMKASLFLSGALLLIFPFARSPVSIIILTFFWSIAYVAFHPASMSVITDAVPPEQRKSAFALVRLAINLGMSVGPAVAGFLAGISFVALFVLDSVTSIMAGTVLTLCSLGKPVRAEAPPADNGHPESLPQPRKVAGDRQFLFFLASMIPVALVFYQSEAAMSLYLVKDLHLATSMYGILFSINTVMIVFLEVPLNVAMQRWAHHHTLALGSLLFGLGFGAFAFVTGPLGAAAAVVVWTFGEMILLPGMSAYVGEIAPARQRGEYMGYFTMVFGLSFAIGPWAGTEILSRCGGRVLWPVAFLFGLLSALMMWRVKSDAVQTEAKNESMA